MDYNITRHSRLFLQRAKAHWPANGAELICAQTRVGRVGSKKKTKLRLPWPRGSLPPGRGSSQLRSPNGWCRSREGNIVSLPFGSISRSRANPFVGANFSTFPFRQKLGKLRSYASPNSRLDPNFGPGRFQASRIFESSIRTSLT